MKKKILIALTLILMGSARLSAQSAPPKEATCPVMPGTRVNPKFYVDFEHRRIFLCCRACARAFKKHPEKYLKNISS